MKKTVNYRIIINVTIRYALLLAVGWVMIYPLLWMMGSTLKNEYQILTEVSFIPTGDILWSNYAAAWNVPGLPKNFIHYYMNSLKIVVPCVVGAAISSTLTGYAFARFEFAGKKVMFSFMMAMMFLPGVVLGIPAYLIWSKLGLIDSHVPLWLPSWLGGGSFFIFLMVQFLRGVPRELDDASIVDGCGPFQLLYYILIPIIKPAIISVALFTFIWTMSDFMGPLIYITSIDKYPIALALRAAIDKGYHPPQGVLMSMTFMAIIPTLVIFFFSQRYFIDGISTTGLKG